MARKTIDDRLQEIHDISFDANYYAENAELEGSTEEAAELADKARQLINTLIRERNLTKDQLEGLVFLFSELAHSIAYEWNMLEDERSKGLKRV